MSGCVGALCVIAVTSKILHALEFLSHSQRDTVPFHMLLRILPFIDLFENRFRVCLYGVYLNEYEQRIDGGDGAG